MSEFHELIKNFERVRDYMRQFFIYGFKVRSEFTQKSGRTYDNERRRIESYLGNYIKSGHNAKGKQISIQVNSKMINENPLYRAWKSRSFTDNDIMLHFFLLDLLTPQKDQKEPPLFSIKELSDTILTSYEMLFEPQTIRLKLKKYEEEGIIIKKKKGKTFYYMLSNTSFLEQSTLYQPLLTAIQFFQEVAPFGFLGSTILDREYEQNTLFRFKHHYIVHTLEDGVLAAILTAIRQKRQIELENKSTKTGRLLMQVGTPLKILVSTQTGRRYLALSRNSNREFFCLRLDAIGKVSLLEEVADYDRLASFFIESLPYCFGVSFQGHSPLAPRKPEKICFTIFLDEEREAYIYQRFIREARGGIVTKLSTNLFQYEGFFYDTYEMLPWIKSFTGRILSLSGENKRAILQLKKDFEKMYEMYL